MRIAELDASLREALFLTESFWRMGFAQEQMYPTVARTAQPENALLADQTRLGDRCVHVVLEHEHLKFIALVGPEPRNVLDTESFERAWKTACETITLAGIAESTFEWERSIARRRMAQFEERLSALGFPITRRRSA